MHIAVPYFSLFCEKHLNYPKDLHGTVSWGSIEDEVDEK